MKNWYILFRDDMVRAILEGCKTQTRRLSKRWAKLKKGDRLLVKESWRYGQLYSDISELQPVYYKAVYYRATDEKQLKGPHIRWEPALFMPRHVVRIELEATADAYQASLQDITEEDARAEGVDAKSVAPSSCRTAFAELWSSINKKPGTRWENHPIVYILKFRHLQRSENISPVMKRIKELEAELRRVKGEVQCKCVLPSTCDAQCKLCQSTGKKYPSDD